MSRTADAAIATAFSRSRTKVLKHRPLGVVTGPPRPLGSICRVGIRT